MVKDALEATRAVFREELEASIHSKCKLAAVKENPRKPRMFTEELEITKSKKGLRAAKAELDDVKADFKAQPKVSKNQRVAAEALDAAKNTFQY